MALVAIQCKNCGGALQVDSAAANYVCPHCHTAYAMEQTINQTFQTTNIERATIIDDGSGAANQEIKSAEACLSFRDYWFARRKFEDLSERYAHMYQVWWGLARAITEDFTAELTGRSELCRMNEALDHALALAPADEKEKIRLTYQPYRVRWETHRDKLLEELKQQLELTEECRLQQIPPIESRIDQLQVAKAHQESISERVSKIATIVPIACSVLVLIVLAVSTLGGCTGFFELILNCLFIAIITVVVIFLPLSIAAFLIIKAVNVPVGVKIGRYDREIKKLDEKASNIMKGLTEEIRTVQAKTSWLDE